MSEFKQYRRTGLSEMRPVTKAETGLTAYWLTKKMNISVSEEDKENGSPKIGDMIARNPKNHNDQWLVAKQYFEDNLELVENKKES